MAERGRVEKIPPSRSRPERQSEEWKAFWQKAEYALAELRSIKNSDEEHLAAISSLVVALEMQDNTEVTALISNEWVRFKGSLHASYYELPKVEDFLVCAAKLENWDSTD